MSASPLIDPSSYFPAVKSYLDHLDTFEKSLHQEEQLNGKIRTIKQSKGPNWTVVLDVLMKEFGAASAERNNAEGGIYVLTSKMKHAASEYGLPAEPFVNMERQRKLENIGPARNTAKRLQSMLPAEPAKRALRRGLTGKHIKDKPLTRRQREAIEMLSKCNKTEAAERLGISRSALDDRLYGAMLRGELSIGRSVATKAIPRDRRGQPTI